MMRSTGSSLFRNLAEEPEVKEKFRLLRESLTTKAETFCTRHLNGPKGELRDQRWEWFTGFVQLDILLPAAHELDSGVPWTQVLDRATKAYDTFEKGILEKVREHKRLHQAELQATADVDTRIQRVQFVHLQFPNKAALVQCLKSRPSRPLIRYLDEKGAIDPFANAEMSQQALRERVEKEVFARAGSVVNGVMMDRLSEDLAACATKSQYPQLTNLGGEGPDEPPLMYTNPPRGEFP
jgi:hypothetical protein